MDARTSGRIVGGLGSGERRTALREDCSAAVMPPLQSGSPWRIVSMAFGGGNAMHVRFRDGLEGEVRFEPTFFRGVFAHLTDPELFAQAQIEMGAVTWPGELDLAPDRMHADIIRNGICTLGAN